MNCFIMKIDAKNRYFSPDHRQLCKVIKTQALGDETTCQVWLPGRDSVVRVPASRLAPLKDSRTATATGNDASPYLTGYRRYP